MPTAAGARRTSSGVPGGLVGLLLVLGTGAVLSGVAFLVQQGLGPAFRRRERRLGPRLA